MSRFKVKMYGSSLLLFWVGIAIGQSNVKLNQLFEEIDAIETKYEMTNALEKGQHPITFPIPTVDNWIKRAGELKGKLNELESISVASLTDQDRINQAIRMLQLKDEISGIEFKTYLITINAEGGYFNWPVFFLPRLPFNNAKDYEDYLTWLPTFVDFIKFDQGLLEKGLQEKIQAPKIIVSNTIALLEPWTSSAKSHPFFRPIDNMPSNFSAAQKTDFQQRAEKIIETKIIPAYKELKQFLERKYLPSSPVTPGISGIANGKAYYENRVKHFTTLNITPDSVFRIGQSEVARIRKRMEGIISDLKFKGSFAEFIAFLRTDDQFYATTGQDLLNRAAWLSKKAEGELPRLFSELYELPFTVAPVPDDIAPNYTGGRYVPGSREQNKPGTYWVNTYNLKSRTLYTLPALTVHEAVPGHHLQIMMASELKDLPSFRQNYYISAFGEGWGLYSEFLGEEMGMYSTPYEMFGRYTYEMWRACRLVVDVGIHYKGWTREQAVTFLAENTALSLHEVNTEIDRYIGWPGQAVSYKMGELTIKKLRAEAEAQLGDAFDIQAFHKIILKNGSVPLPILEDEVRKWMKSL